MVVASHGRCTAPTCSSQGATTKRTSETDPCIEDSLSLDGVASSLAFHLAHNAKASANVLVGAYRSSEALATATHRTGCYAKGFEANESAIAFLKV